MISDLSAVILETLDAASFEVVRRGDITAVPGKQFVRSGGGSVCCYKLTGCPFGYGLVSFRGSSSVQDWVGNLRPLPSIELSFNGKKSTIHGGFYDTYNSYAGFDPSDSSTWADLLSPVEEPETQESRKGLLVAGSSLGGAHAQIFAWIWGAQKATYVPSFKPLMKVVTYGAPNPFQSYETVFEDKEFRFAHICAAVQNKEGILKTDLVASLPPDWKILVNPRDIVLDRTRQATGAFWDVRDRVEIHGSRAYRCSDNGAMGGIMLYRGFADLQALVSV